DDKLLASAGQDTLIKIWDPMTGHLLKKLTYFPSGATEVAFSADGTKLVAAAGGAIQIWDVASWQELGPVPDPGVGGWVGSVAFSPTGGYLAACGCLRGGITLWKIMPGGESQEAGGSLKLQRIARPSSRTGVWSLAFSPDGELLAWVEAEEYHSTSNTLHLW